MPALLVKEYPPSIRVALVEDDPTQRAYLVAALRTASDLAIVSISSSAEEALAMLPGIRPDVVLMDIQLPRQNGIEAVRQLGPLMPQTRFMMLSVAEDAERVLAALRAGASGYLLKGATPERLIEAVRDLRRGGSPMSPVIARHVIACLHPSALAAEGSEELTAREREILDHLRRGHLYKEIASALGIGLGTVRTHVSRIYRKLDVHNKTEAAVKNVNRWEPGTPP